MKLDYAFSKVQWYHPKAVKCGDQYWLNKDVLCFLGLIQYQKEYTKQWIVNQDGNHYIFDLGPKMAFVAFTNPAGIQMLHTQCI